MAEFSEKNRTTGKKDRTEPTSGGSGNAINLIPSESTPSFTGENVFHRRCFGRYAEHRVMKGKEVYFYQGN